MFRGFWLPGLVLGISAVVVGPAAAGAPPPEATVVGSEVCVECHDAEEGAYDGVHMRIHPFEVEGREVGCEGCHGPGSMHAEEADPELIRSFPIDDPANTEACLSCHRSTHTTAWTASTHAMEQVGCLSCHSIHQASEPEGTCRSCHVEEVTRFELPSHHPVREGKMSCGSCHDVHGATEAALKTGFSNNDLCYQCHQDKEGPFVFEHPPVFEDCSTCHEPHGTVADDLLVANEPVICLQCHEFHFHAGYQSAEAGEVEVGGIERENPFGTEGFNIAFTTNCTQCHFGHHGSDSPSQTVTNGAGLTH